MHFSHNSHLSTFPTSVHLWPPVPLHSFSSSWTLPTFPGLFSFLPPSPVTFHISPPLHTLSSALVACLLAGHSLQFSRSAPWSAFCTLSSRGSQTRCGSMLMTSYSPTPTHTFSRLLVPLLSISSHLPFFCSARNHLSCQHGTSRGWERSYAVISCPTHPHALHKRSSAFGFSAVFTFPRAPSSASWVLCSGSLHPLASRHRILHLHTPFSSVHLPHSSSHGMCGSHSFPPVSAHFAPSTANPFLHLSVCRCFSVMPPRSLPLPSVSPVSSVIPLLPALPLPPG